MEVVEVRRAERKDREGGKMRSQEENEMRTDER